MYRAKVEAVDGLHIRAGGKMLRCIGNRIFCVGDWVYTDGRCAYGYDKESMSPIVIINNLVTDDLVVPIQFGNLLCYFSNTLHNIGTLPNNSNGIVHNNKKNILFSSFDKNNLNIYTRNKDIVLSANCDAQGNVFELSVLQNSYVHILKNNEILKTVPLKSDVFVIWGFIENIDNWAFISYKVEYTETFSAGLDSWLWEAAVNERGEATADGSPALPLEEYYRAVLYEVVAELGGTYESYTYNGTMTFSNSAGQTIDFVSVYASVSRNWIDRLGSYDVFSFGADKIDSYSIDYSTMSNIKFPMQDGFYFTMQNPIFPYRDVIGLPLIVEKTIFTPDGKQIFSDYFQIPDNFLACELSRDKYLVVDFTPDVNDKNNLNVLEGKTAYTIQQGFWDYHPYGDGFYADFDETLNLDKTTYLKIGEKILNNRNSSFVIDTNGNAIKQDWYHLGYNLRKIPKKYLLSWFKQLFGG